MRFSELADYFEKLEQTSSRLALIDILAELFKKAKGDEIYRIVYLVQGRVAPFFEPVEFGVANKTVASAISLAYGLSKEEVLQEYAKIGDLGLVVAKLGKEKRRRVQKDQFSVFQVSIVFDQLKQLTLIKGVGTVETKITRIRQLLENLDAISAKYLVRILLGNLRLGIGDPTILDALATAKFGDKSKRKILEGAYNRTSDLGLIAKALWTGGIKMVEELKVRVGFPIRSELCERLPNPEKVFEKMSFGRGVHVTYKYDGFRVQIHKNGDKVSMFSRNLEDMTHMFPELIAGTLKQVKAKTAILDSEAMAYQPESEEFLPFQETTKRRRKYKIEEMSKSLPLRAFVFDILYADSKSLLETPLVERMEKLQKIVEKDDTLIPSTGEILASSKDLQLMLDDAISKGLEGVVVKRVDSKYEAGGRNFNWVKLKRHSAGELQDTIDCVILGYVYGRGKRTAFGAGALLVGVYDSQKDEFVTVSKIGTGLTDAEWKSIKSRTENLERRTKPARVSSLIVPSVWVEPEIVIEVLADEITRSPVHTAGMQTRNLEPRTENDEKKDFEGAGYALRFPRLVSFRDKDKKAEDATSVAELIDMYQQQTKK